MRRTGTAEAEIRRRMGAVVEAKRAALKIAPAVLAAAAEVDDRQMARVLAGKAGLSFYSLGRVAAALGCTADEILRASMPARGGTRDARRSA